MKTILLPCDFSSLALNAIEYGAEIARHTHAKLILFHVYTGSVDDGVKKQCLENLKKIEADLTTRHGEGLEVQSRCKNGVFLNEINNFCENQQVDLIVMGMKGSGYLREKFMGNTTTSVIDKVNCSVMIIGEDVKYRGITKIAFACDYEDQSYKTILTDLIDFAHLFHSPVYILNVVPETEAPVLLSKQVENYKFDRILEGIEHSFHQVQNEDLIDGINEFVEDHAIDLVVMIPKMHSMIENIFNDSNTKRMAFHAKVPLLSLHETREDF
ncbi:MAG: hypothetical protein K0R65_1721 [Crocinitomicaceae bacterium]|jgi:nucleotide-binding universal stress UspA family protein|nr:hypothetical protein [Crocinitomicaceae bacterium]